MERSQLGRRRRRRHSGWRQALGSLTSPKQDKPVSLVIILILLGIVALAVAVTYLFAATSGGSAI